jgi:hypothetical protein
LFLEEAAGYAANASRHHRANGQNDQGPNELKAVIGQKFNNLIFAASIAVFPQGQMFSAPNQLRRPIRVSLHDQVGSRLNMRRLLGVFARFANRKIAAFLVATLHDPDNDDCAGSQMLHACRLSFVNGRWEPGLYADRVARRHRHHRHPRGLVVARAGFGQRKSRRAADKSNMRSLIAITI